MAKQRQFHNLDGWSRDVQAAMREGGERAYLLAELIADLLDLIDVEAAPTADGVAGGADDGEDGVCDSDGSVGADEASDEPHDGVEDVDADSAGLVRVPDGTRDQLHLPMGGAGRTGGGPAKRRSAVLTDAELVEELAVRNLNPNGKVRLSRGTRTT